MNLAELLSWIASLLLIPDMILLVILLCFTLLSLGGFVSEYLERRRSHAAFRRLMTQLKQDSAHAPVLIPPKSLYGLVRRALVEHTTHADAAKLMEDLHLAAEKTLGRMHLGIRLGPMLGLIGTLVPLGPALKGMAAGDIHNLADHLVIAFSCPVIGIASGGVCFFMHSVRQHWYQQDLSDIEFLLPRIALPAEHAPKSSTPSTLPPVSMIQPLPSREVA